MASMRAGLEEYLLRGLLILIVSSQLCCSTPITTPSPKPTEFLSKNFTVNATSTRQRKQNISTVEISQTSAVTLLPSIALENRKNSSAVHLEKRGCSRKRDGCPRFVDKYSSFYLKIGGWLMLGIVLAGITALGVTHYLGMKNMRRPRRRQLSRILWVEALTKSKLARFV